MSGAVDSSETFSGFEESMTKRPMYTDQQHAGLAFHRFSLLREKNLLTDAVILSNDDKRFNVHTIIMAGTSDYYFNNLLKADECQLFGTWRTLDSCQVNIDSTALEMIIAFCYSGGIELTVDNVEMVLAGAKVLEIDKLILLCGEMLEQMLDGTNCIRFLEIADKYGLDELAGCAMAILADELPHINQLPEFYHLNGSQMLWLIEQLSSVDDGLFGNLLSSVYKAENAFSINKPAYTDDTQSAFRAAFIIGFFEGEKCRSSQLQLSQLHDTEHDLTVLSVQPHKDDSQLVFEQSECESEFEQLTPPPLHVLGLLKRHTIQFSILCDLQQKWERSTKPIELTHAIESFRDAIMFPFNKQLVIFHMRNGSILHAQNLILETATVENVTVPNDVERTNLALFCRLNDMIYCFARSDQQFFQRYDPILKTWSAGQIKEVKDAKFIVGVKDELYFVGCGFSRTMVRSYHLGQKEWTERGNLRHETTMKLTCFKAIALNNSIYVVMSCYDSSKMYNGIEFIIQRYDENVEDWVIIKRIYYSHFVDYFNLEAIDNSLYLSYGDGEVQIYNDELNEWRKGPTIDYNVLDVSMCMLEVNPNDSWLCHQ